MAKMKWDESFDDEGLDGAEYDAEKDAGFTAYDGPTPRAGTIIAGVVKKAWVATSKAGNYMIKVIWEAEGNKGDKAVYDGLSIWTQVVFMKEHPGLYKPFLNVFGLTVADVKAKTVVDDEDKMGKPILKIGNWKPGTKNARVSVQTKMETYNGEQQVRVAKFLAPVVDSDDVEDDDDDAPF